MGRLLIALTNCFFVPAIVFTSEPGSLVRYLGVLYLFLFSLYGYFYVFKAVQDLSIRLYVLMGFTIQAAVTFLYLVVNAYYYFL